MNLSSIEDKELLLHLIRFSLITVLATAFMASSPLLAQTWDSGSDGSDGALDLSTPGTVVFDPGTFIPPLDVDGDGVYNFTSITIAAGVTVRLRAIPLGTRPVVWLASEIVQIDGVLDLSGENGHFGRQAQVVAIGGAGGFEGGVGGGNNTIPATPGAGPGGGRTPGDGFKRGAGASYALDGYLNDAGKTYGNNFLQPLIGGSGGGGGGFFPSNTVFGGGGGAGGGAILIASSASIVLDGLIVASGGHGGCDGENSIACGGGGSGGAIRLMAPVIVGVGSITNIGGRSIRVSGGLVNSSASVGRTRLEAFQIDLTGISEAGSIRTILSGPGNVFPSEDAPALRVVSVGGVPVPINPSGSFTPADLTIDTTGDVLISIEASGVPLGTVVNLRLYNQTEGIIDTTSDPLAGTLESSSATATANIPPGFTRFTVEASWTP